MHVRNQRLVTCPPRSAQFRIATLLPGEWHEPVRCRLTVHYRRPTPLGELTINEDRDAEHPPVVQVVEGGKFTVLP